MKHEMTFDFENRVDDQLEDIQNKLDRILAIIDKPKVARKVKSDESYLSEVLSTSSFEIWWKLYPKKIAKKKCLSFWITHSLIDIQHTLIADTQNRKANDQQWVDGYAPHALTYLRGERWNDDITPIREKGEPLPRDDNKLMSWAAEHDYPDPYKAETYTAYRGRLQTIHNGAQQ